MTNAKYDVSVSYGWKVIANVNVDNRQTSRQDKSSMPPIVRSWGRKSGDMLTYDMWVIWCGKRVEYEKIIQWGSFVCILDHVENNKIMGMHHCILIKHKRNTTTTYLKWT